MIETGSFVVAAGGPVVAAGTTRARTRTPDWLVARTGAPAVRYPGARSGRLPHWWRMSGSGSSWWGRVRCPVRAGCRSGIGPGVGALYMVRLRTRRTEPPTGCPATRNADRPDGVVPTWRTE
ncbi:hypothetical protein CA850_12830 [Micromonospora echinospora]|nr:hypothetical protein CA850_12830 [Micromonospora echinospora]